MTHNSRAIIVSGESIQLQRGTMSANFAVLHVWVLPSERTIHMEYVTELATDTVRD